MDESPQVSLELWQGEVEAALPATLAGAAWPLLASFCALHRYMPGIDVCERVAGEDGQPGCVRHVAALAPGAGAEGQMWAWEQLLEVDGAARRLRYAMVDGNMGLRRYVATLRVLEEGEGCKVAWAFECEPVEGWSKEGFLSHLDGSVKAMAKGLQEAAVHELSRAASDAKLSD